MSRQTIFAGAPRLALCTVLALGAAGCGREPEQSSPRVNPSTPNAGAAVAAAAFLDAEIGALSTLSRAEQEAEMAWFANAAAGMSRSYYEDARAGAEPQVSAARTGVAVFADDFQTIRVFAERDNTNIAHWSRFERGGHFAALEVPEVVAGDLRAFFSKGA